jgi:peptidoglycan/LPS O-acetylase OafA/YrhL
VRGGGFAEFGASDGVEGNAAFPAQVLGWPGALFEADEAAFGSLERRYRGTDRVRTVHAAVEPDTVEALFAAAAVPEEPDLLSIDVDGNDYWIWRALERFRPRVVVVEYNGDLDPREPLVQPYTPGRRWDHSSGYGASLAALEALATEKGYGSCTPSWPASTPSSCARRRPARSLRRRGPATVGEPHALRPRPSAAAPGAGLAVAFLRERGFPALDSLRAIAALSVFVFHAVGFYARGATQGNTIAPYVARMDVGVTIFFLLSGFLLYRPFVQARRTGRPPPPLIPYAWRRALRIVPAYWVALTLATIVLALPGVFTLTGIPTFYGFLQIYDADTAFKGLGQCWTLCVEVAFYAFLPLWARLLRRVAPGRSLRAELIALAALAAAGVLYKVLVLSGLAPLLPLLQPLLLALPGFLDHFALGMALAVVVVGWEERGEWPAAVTRWPLAWWVGAAAVFLGVAAASGLDATPAESTHTEYAVRHAANAVVALLLLVPAVAGGGAPGADARLDPDALAGRDLLRHLPVPPAAPAAALRRGPLAVGVRRAPVPAVVRGGPRRHPRARHRELVPRRAAGAAAQAAGGPVAAARPSAGSAAATSRAANTMATRLSAGSSQSQSSPACSAHVATAAIAADVDGPARPRARRAEATTPPKSRTRQASPARPSSAAVSK